IIIVIVKVIVDSCFISISWHCSEYVRVVLFKERMYTRHMLGYLLCRGLPYFSQAIQCLAVASVAVCEQVFIKLEGCMTRRFIMLRRHLLHVSLYIWKLNTSHGLYIQDIIVVCT